MIDLPFPLRVGACGAITAAGLAAPATFAALRAGVAAFQQTCYRTSYGEPIVGAPVLGLEAAALGREYLLALAGPALEECLLAIAQRRDAIGLLLGVSDDLPQQDARRLLTDLAESHGFDAASPLALLSAGEHSLLHGLARAAEWLRRGSVGMCIVGGVDTYLTRTALHELEQQGRLKTSRNSDGVIPGEAACFVAVTQAEDTHVPALESSLVVRGLGLSSPGDTGAQRGDGMTFAIRNALHRAGVAARDVSFRPTNQSGESVLALESGIASMRVFRDPGPYPPAWLPAGSIGAVGSAVGALLLGWTATGFAKNYAPGNIALLEFVSMQAAQGALVATAT